MDVHELLEKWSRGEVRRGDRVEVSGFLWAEFDCWLAQDNRVDVAEHKELVVQLLGNKEVFLCGIPGIMSDEYSHMGNAVVIGRLHESDRPPCRIALTAIEALTFTDDDGEIYESTFGATPAPRGIGVDEEGRRVRW